MAQIFSFVIIQYGIVLSQLSIVKASQKNVMAHLYTLIAQYSIMMSAKHCEGMMKHTDIIIMNCDFTMENRNTIIKNHHVEDIMCDFTVWDCYDLMEHLVRFLSFTCYNSALYWQNEPFCSNNLI